MAFIAMAMERTFVTKVIRWIFAWIDWVFYHIASFLMQAVFDIAEFSFSQDMFDKVISRVYLILGIFMLFKITISLITYLVNPDKMNDKENGVGKLVTRVMLVLVMLIMLPTAFQFLTRIQGPLLETLPRIILSVSIDEDDNTAIMQDKGSRISWNVFSAFFYNNPDCVGYDSSSGNDSSLKVDFGDVSNPLSEAVSRINDSCSINNDGSMYQFEYTPVVSTIAGGFMCYTLLGVCIMVAIRMFKLIILQMIAPIPIISYVDPKASKDGAFNNWIKAVITTWLEVFVVIGVMYLIVFVIDNILLSGAGEFADRVVALGWRRGAFFTVFVILGLFMFAKQAPKFILDALGIKSKGTFGKAMGLAGSVLGMGGASIASGRSSYMASNTDTLPQKGIALMKSIPAGLLGGIAGAGAAGSAALSADKNQTKAAFDALSKRNATVLAQGDAGSTSVGRGISSFARIAFGDTPATIGKRKIANLEAENKALNAVVARADEEAVKSFDTKASISKGSNIYTNYKDFAARMEAAKTAKLDKFEYTAYEKDANGNWVSTTKTMSMFDAELNVQWIKKDNANNYIEQVQAGTIKDVRMPTLMKDAELKTGRKFNSRNEIKDYQDTIENQITEQQRKNARAAQNDRFSGQK